MNLWFFPGQLNRCGDVGEVQSTVGDRKRVEFVELNNLSTIELLSTVENTLVEYSFFCAARVVGDSKEYDVDVLVLELVLVFELVDVLELV